MSLDRRVLCDRTVPVCQRCVQSRRRCAGYGLQLSWPGSKRRTRSKPESAPWRGGASGPLARVQWLHTSFADLAMHYHLADAGPYGAKVRWKSSFVHAVPLPTASRALWTPFKLDDEQTTLFQYFEAVTSRSLPTFGYEPGVLCSVIMPMAMSDNSPSSTAVLLSLLALAALDRDGLQRRSISLKLQALSALRVSVLSPSSTMDLVRHVAAGMLLCSYEIHSKTRASGHWLWYLCGAQTIIKAGRLDRPNRDGSVTLLLGWTQYYTTMARFSLRHWVRSETREFAFARDVGYHDTMPPVCKTLPVGDLEDTPHKLLDLLGRAIDTVVEPTKPHHHSQGYRQDVELLGSALTSGRFADSSGKADDMELFRLAILVYLHRAAEPILGHPEKLADCIARAFEALAHIDGYRYPFALLIFGHEARTDEQRMTVLRLIGKTRETSPADSLASVGRIVRFLWVHDDLMDGGQDYLGKLSAAISSASALPFLV
ncbi:hypothetical protein JDV02_003811 [Purpureocillium takamizusanense]|uniref:Uncharacterized protein n=1 Tax=Purpureocillium takamizusanense TaxID=2060973 RepID=A0A9Q8QD46_9HYPO|nr:uncharacterized protein JDV02_003811 [Purpureocillium takamizusanense]UNI17470.1 hypothetical protein JDV02_003811 [Purpureocillium takamizusanense]